MTESQAYDQCLDKLAQACQDADRICNLIMRSGEFPPQMLEDAQKIKAAADQAMLGLIELRMGVI